MHRSVGLCLILLALVVLSLESTFDTTRVDYYLLNDGFDMDFQQTWHKGHTVAPGHSHVLAVKPPNPSYRINVRSTQTRHTMTVLCGDQDFALFEESMDAFQGYHWLGNVPMKSHDSSEPLSCNFMTSRFAADHWETEYPGYVTITNHGTEDITYDYGLVYTSGQLVTLDDERHHSFTVDTGNGVDAATVGMFIVNVAHERPRYLTINVMDSVAGHLNIVQVNSNEYGHVPDMYETVDIAGVWETTITPGTSHIIGYLTRPNLPYDTLITAQIRDIDASQIITAIPNAKTDFSFARYDEVWMTFTVPDSTKDDGVLFTNFASIHVTDYDPGDVAISVSRCHTHLATGECTDRLPSPIFEDITILTEAPAVVDFDGHSKSTQPLRSGIYWIHLTNQNPNAVFPVTGRLTLLLDTCGEGIAGPYCPNHGSAIVDVKPLDTSTRLVKAAGGATGPTVARLVFDPAYSPDVVITIKGVRLTPGDRVDAIIAPYPYNLPTYNTEERPATTELPITADTPSVDVTVRPFTNLYGDDGRVFITLYSNADVEVEIDFTLDAYCNEHGAVNPATGICSCRNGYTPADGCFSRPLSPLANTTSTLTLPMNDVVTMTIPLHERPLALALQPTTPTAPRSLAIVNFMARGRHVGVPLVVDHSGWTLARLLAPYWGRVDEARLTISSGAGELTLKTMGLLPEPHDHSWHTKPAREPSGALEVVLTIMKVCVVLVIGGCVLLAVALIFFSLIGLLVLIIAGIGVTLGMMSKFTTSRREGGEGAALLDSIDPMDEI